jgi:hypothetical protein
MEMKSASSASAPLIEVGFLFVSAFWPDGLTWMDLSDVSDKSSDKFRVIRRAMGRSGIGRPGTDSVFDYSINVTPTPADFQRTWENEHTLGRIRGENFIAHL